MPSLEELLLLARTLSPQEREQLLRALGAPAPRGPDLPLASPAAAALSRPDVRDPVGWRKAEAGHAVLAVEILSSEQGADYVEERLDDYWKLGTAEIWIVDPLARTLVGYARERQGFQIFAQAEGEEEFSSRLLAGLSFGVARLWMRP